jgi:cytochrome c553
MILAALVLAAAFIAWLARSSRQPPMLPQDDVHAAAGGAGACMSCHGPDGPVPQSPRHPLGQECFRCHGTR